MKRVRRDVFKNEAYRWNVCNLFLGTHCSSFTRLNKNKKEGAESGIMSSGPLDM